MAAFKGKWEGESAGGSPNNDTFTDNPQFLLQFPHGRTEFVIDLVSTDDYGNNTMIVMMHYSITCH